MGQAEGQGRIDVRASLREQLRRLIDKIKVDPVKGSFAVFFHTGERRLLTLESGLVFDAYPKGKGHYQKICQVQKPLRFTAGNTYISDEIYCDFPHDLWR